MRGKGLFDPKMEKKTLDRNEPRESKRGLLTEEDRKIYEPQMRSKEGEKNLDARTRTV